MLQVGCRRYLASLLMLIVSCPVSFGASQAPTVMEYPGATPQPVTVPDPPPISLEIITARGQYSESTELFDNSTGTRQLGLLATVTNISGFPVTISTWADAVINIESVTVDGHPLAPSIMAIDFDEDPYATASSALVTLAPSTNTTFPINTIWKLISSGQDSDVLVYSSFGLYTPFARGRYWLSFEYSYPGPDDGFPNVYHGTVKASVEFEVTK